MAERDEILIDKIQEIRSINNRVWMRLVRLAMRECPEEAREIFREIERNDAMILQIIRETYGEGG
jgi:hypothetical protein